MWMSLWTSSLVEPSNDFIPNQRYQTPASWDLQVRTQLTYGAVKYSKEGL